MRQYTKDLTAGAGTYSVTVTDASNCTKTITGLTITEPMGIVGTSNITNAICNGGTGSINLSVNGGASGYTYVWSNLATTQDLTNVGTGSYSVTITDANNCTKTYSNLMITEPAAIATSTSIVDITCNGMSNGSINLSVSGGTGAYTYAWSNTATTEDLSALGAGTYAVTVTDANNCTSTLTGLTVNEPTAITAIPNITNVSCNGGNDGSVMVTATGGTGGPYSMSWSTGSSAGLAAGSYTVTVSDGNGCSNMATYTVNEPTVLLAIPAVAQPIACSGGMGALTATIGGGTAPYTTVWTDAAGGVNQIFQILENDTFLLNVSYFCQQALVDV